MICRQWEGGVDSAEDISEDGITCASEEWEVSKREGKGFQAWK